MAKFAAKDSNKNITLSPHGTGKVVVGTGAADATVQSDGNHNLVLQTGNSTTGSISITDGADGNIAISPNGTGTVVVNTDLDVDNININGNAITSTNTDGNIDLTPNGTGEVNISKVDIDSGTIDGTDVTVGASKTLDVSAGTLTTSTAQKEAIVTGGQTNQLVPSNLVAYRASGESTPSGWSEYTSARGRMIVGLQSGGSDGGTVGSTLSDQQDRVKTLTHQHTGPSHAHQIHNANLVHNGNLQFAAGAYYSTSGSFTATNYIVYTSTTTGSNPIPVTNTEGTGNTGTGGVNVNTSDLLAYIQLMAIKKD